MDRRRHRQPGGNPDNGSGGNLKNGKNDKIGTDGRNGTTEYRFPEPPSHFANFFASQSIVFSHRFRVQTEHLTVRTTDAHVTHVSAHLTVAQDFFYERV